MSNRYDLIVVGGGPAGYTAAIRGGQLGMSVLSIEREYMGGVCLNWGCIPSKALISAAGRWESLQNAGVMGIDVAGAELDFARTQEWKDGIVEQLTGGVEGLVKTNGGTVVYGQARLVGPSKVVVESAAGERTEYEASRGIVVATGARPIQIPGFEPDGERILSAREAVSLTEVPKRLVVIGGGVIGIELGTLYARLGSAVTVVELTEQILPGLDRDLVRVVEKRLEKRGVRLLTSTRAISAQRRGDEVVVSVQTPQEAEELAADCVLVAVGFRPNTEHLGLAELGVELDGRGHIRVDARYETNIEGLFAVGDVTGPPYLAHKAFKEAEIAADAIAGRRVERDWLAMPAVVFSDPEIAVVGMGEEEARRENIDIEVGRFPFSVLGRALSIGERDGFVKVIAGQDRVLGVGIVGPEASELIAESTFAIEMMAAPEDVGLTIHAHPTLSEALHEAMRHSVGEAIHIRNRRRSAEPSPRVRSAAV